MATESRIQRRIFVVGVPRSGTTLVQSLLAAHSRVTSFTESHFFSRHFTVLPGLSTSILTRNPVPGLREFLAENDEHPTDAASWFEGRQALRVRPCLPLLTRAVARKLLGVLDELTLRRGKEIWIEKTPRHLRHIPLIEGIEGAPNTSFVHVIRDGLETVASLHQASRNWQQHYDLKSCVRRWNKDVGLSLRRIQKPNDHFVFYEELTSQPEAVLKRLLLQLDLDWEPSILKRYSNVSGGLITRRETWKEDIGRSIRRSETSNKVLDTEQRHRVRQTLCENLYEQILATTTTSAKISS